MVRSNAVTNADLNDRLTTLETSVEEIKIAVDSNANEMQNFKGLATDIAQLQITANKVLRWIKFGLPSIISAAIASGVVSGKFGAFLHALI